MASMVASLVLWHLLRLYFGRNNGLCYGHSYGFFYGLLYGLCCSLLYEF